MEFDGHKSIFLQIAETIMEKVVKGDYQPGDRITSVREMAGEMGVNHNTIMRAYMELQNKGIIDQKRGMGNFVSEKARDIILTERKQEFFDRTLPDFRHQAELLGITPEELKKHLGL